MRILAIDPSYTRTGVYSNYPFKNSPNKIKKLEAHSYFTSLEHPNNEPQFAYLLAASRKISDMIQAIVKEVKPTVLVMEYAAVQGNWAVGLGFLNATIVNDLLSNTFVKEIHLIPPNMVNSYLGARKVAKSVIVAKAEELIGGSKPKINHDEATAFILAEIIHNKLIDKRTKKLTTFVLSKDNKVKRLE